MDVAAQIVRRRKQLLVHRFIYYVRGESVITDLQYDTWERELRWLVREHHNLADECAYADDCPTKCVGSSNLWDYPRELQHVGDALIAWVEQFPFGYIAPESEESEPAIEQPGLF